MPSDSGSALLVSYATAYVALVHRVNIKQCDVVLVTAAAGALGLASVDIAANIFRARVIAVCGSDDKCDLAKQYGAQETINYTSENVRERVKQLTDGRGVDIAVDVVGGKTLDDCLKSMALDGRLVTLGYAGGQIPKIPANILLLKNCSVHGVWFGDYMASNKSEIAESAVQAVVQLWTERKIRPHIGKIFPLTQVNEAIQHIMSRKSTGKVILNCRA